MHFSWIFLWIFEFHGEFWRKVDWQDTTFLYAHLYENEKQIKLWKMNWKLKNKLKENASKCHLLISSDKNVLVNIDIDCKLSFENHINQTCSKARAKIKILARTAPFLNKRKRKLLKNAIFKSQFTYCPLSYGCFIAVH